MAKFRASRGLAWIEIGPLGPDSGRFRPLRNCDLVEGGIFQQPARRLVVPPCLPPLIPGETLRWPCGQNPAGVGPIAQPQVPVSPREKASMRLAISSGGTTSTGVARLHLWPKGSLTLPMRSPQNWLVTGITTSAPAATAFAKAASTSAT